MMFWGVIHANTNMQIQKYTKIHSPEACKPIHILHLVLNMFEIIFWGVIRATTKTQIQKYITYGLDTANNFGMLFSCGVSVCPWGTGLGNEHFLRLYWIYTANCGMLFSAC